MSPPRRLDTHPLTPLDRGEAFVFQHNGQPVEAYRGETLAAALYAAGHAVLSRSMRYHRARGLYCGTGGCTHCFLRIDGVPNQRACVTAAEPTTWCEDQNAFPSVRHDFLGAADLAFPRYLDPHTSFIRPAFLKSLYTGVIRAMAGFGRVPKAPVAQAFRSEERTPDVLVVGGGPAGLAAARAATEAGLNVLLVDERAKLGGRLRHLPTPFHGVSHPAAPAVEGKAYATEEGVVLKRAGVELRARTRLFGIYNGGACAAATTTTLLRIRPRRTILAPGAFDHVDPFPGSDRAGVLLPTAAFELLNVHGIVPADPILIYGSTREGLLLARDLVACGARVVGIYEPGITPRAPALVEDARRLGVPIQVGHRAAFVAGRTRPRAVVFDSPTGRLRVPCATVILAAGRAPLGELFQQAGTELVPHAAGGFVPRLSSTLETTIPGLYAAGSAAGVQDEYASVLQGRIAGTAAALSLRAGDRALVDRLEEALDAYRHGAPAASSPEREVSVR